MSATCSSVSCGSLSALWDNRLRSPGVSKGKVLTRTLVVLCISSLYSHVMSAHLVAQETALGNDRCGYSQTPVELKLRCFGAQGPWWMLRYCGNCTIKHALLEEGCRDAMNATTSGGET